MNVAVIRRNEPALSASDVSCFGWWLGRQRKEVEAWCESHPEAVREWQEKIDRMDAERREA